MGTGVKRPRREADHSPPSSAEVKNVWSISPLPQYVFMAWCFVKQRKNCKFTFNILILPFHLCLGFASGFFVAFFTFENFLYLGVKTPGRRKCIQSRPRDCIVHEDEIHMYM